MIRSVVQSSDNSDVFSPRQPSRRMHAPYLEGLNPEQRAAVEALDGPVLVLAGAGVGKTRVLTTRIAHLIASGRARAHEILAVTFTNKAAREMRERVSLFTGAHQGMPWLGTFHSIGVKILRMHAELVGLRPNFTILDTDDQLQAPQADPAGRRTSTTSAGRPARSPSLIDGWKNRGLDPAHVPAGESSAFAGGRGAALYAAYQARLKTLNAVDFGDLLLEALRLFRENADVLAGFQRRFRYILVDEYQDTNAVQYLWLRLLAQRAAATSAASATTTSRSTAGAAPTSTTSCASRRTSPAPGSSGSSATTARAGISSRSPRG